MTIMHEKIIDAKDFKIQNLERIVAGLEAEIVQLKNVNRDAFYWADMALTQIKIVADQRKETIRKAFAGEMEKPTLREIEGG